MQRAAATLMPFVLMFGHTLNVHRLSSHGVMHGVMELCTGVMPWYITPGPECPWLEMTQWVR